MTRVLGVLNPGLALVLTDPNGEREVFPIRIAVFVAQRIEEDGERFYGPLSLN